MPTPPDASFTKADPGPFDAHATAKPDEPIFTLQGGDPLGPPSVLFWVRSARDLAFTLEDEKASQNLLIRASAAEQVAWAMQAYQKDWPAYSILQAGAAAKTSATYSIDVYSVRKALATKCSQANSELAELVEQLQTFEHDESEALFYAPGFNAIDNARRLLQQAASYFGTTRPPT